MMLKWKDWKKKLILFASAIFNEASFITLERIFSSWKESHLSEGKKELFDASDMV